MSAVKSGARLHRMGYTGYSLDKRKQRNQHRCTPSDGHGYFPEPWKVTTRLQRARCGYVAPAAGPLAVTGDKNNS